MTWVHRYPARHAVLAISVAVISQLVLCGRLTRARTHILIRTRPREVSLVQTPCWLIRPLPRSFPRWGARVWWQSPGLSTGLPRRVARGS
jgi:hypothetical protein